MIPAKLTESKYFANFLRTLNPNFKLPSRRNYMIDFKKDCDVLLEQLKLWLAKVSYVATNRYHDALINFHPTMHFHHCNKLR